MVFTTHPGSPGVEGDRSPTYWSGTNRLPRVAQYKNVLIALYKLKNYTVIGQRHFYNYTHAFFPRWAFDTVETVGNWNFGKAGDSYIALYSQRRPEWTEEGREAGVEIVASGKTNVWICHLGRREEDGSFDRFKASVLEAPLLVEGLNVDYAAPGVSGGHRSGHGPGIIRIVVIGVQFMSTEVQYIVPLFLKPGQQSHFQVVAAVIGSYRHLHP